MLRRKDFAKDIASPLNTIRNPNHTYSFVIYLKENYGKKYEHFNFYFWIYFKILEIIFEYILRNISAVSIQKEYIYFGSSYLECLYSVENDLWQHKTSWCDLEERTLSALYHRIV